MLIWHYIVLIFRVEGLIVGWNVNFVVWKLIFAEVFEEICVSWAVEVYVGMVGIFGLWKMSEYLRLFGEDVIPLY
jgi:hypothetical protein